METKELNGNGRIRIARTEIDVPHLNEMMTFGFPLLGPDYYQKVMSAISDEGMLRPTTSQMFSLIDLAFKNSDEEHCKDIISKLRNNWLWTSTENLYTPKEIIVYDNTDGKMPSDRESLLNMNKNGNKAVRIVPYEFKRESQSISDLVKNPYILAQVGSKEFAEDVVARVAEKISKNKHYVWALNPVDSNEKRYTALYSVWDDSRLAVDGLYHADDRDGCASGVSRSAEGAAKK